jgi:hypothetical protein
VRLRADGLNLSDLKCILAVHRAVHAPHGVFGPSAVVKAVAVAVLRLPLAGIPRVGGQGRLVGDLDGHRFLDLG